MVTAVKRAFIQSIIVVYSIIIICLLRCNVRSRSHILLNTFLPKMQLILECNLYMIYFLPYEAFFGANDFYSKTTYSSKKYGTSSHTIESWKVIKGFLIYSLLFIFLDNVNCTMCQLVENSTPISAISTSWSIPLNMIYVIVKVVLSDIPEICVSFHH